MICFLLNKNIGQFVITWAPSAYCVFVIISGVILLTACCIQIHRLGHFIYRGLDRLVLLKENDTFENDTFYYVQLFPVSICGCCWQCLPMFSFFGFCHDYYSWIWHLVWRHYSTFWRVSNFSCMNVSLLTILIYNYSITDAVMQRMKTLTKWTISTHLGFICCWERHRFIYFKFFSEIYD